MILQGAEWSQRAQVGISESSQSHQKEKTMQRVIPTTFLGSLIVWVMTRNSAKHSEERANLSRWHQAVIYNKSNTVSPERKRAIFVYWFPYACTLALWAVTSLDFHVSGEVSVASQQQRQHRSPGETAKTMQNEGIHLMGMLNSDLGLVLTPSQTVFHLPLASEPLPRHL